jgi:hypothetical protein
MLTDKALLPDHRAGSGGLGYKIQASFATVAVVLSRDPQVQGQTPIKSQSSYRPVDLLTFCLNTCDLNGVVDAESGN